MSDEVDAIEARARTGYPGRNQRERFRRALDDVHFLVRAVRNAEGASRGFVDAICAGILVPDVEIAKAFRKSRESGGSIPAEVPDDRPICCGGHGSRAPEPPVLNKTGGSPRSVACPKCGAAAGDRCIGRDGTPTINFHDERRALNKSGGCPVVSEWNHQPCQKPAGHDGAHENSASVWTVDR